MREILFRGFTPEENGRDKVFVHGKWIKGRWLQGSYMTLDDTTYCFKEDYKAHPDNTKHYIVFDEMVDWGLPNRHLQGDVLPETVGQYTGLTDKNGNKIFEGDIVSFKRINALGYTTSRVGDVRYYDKLPIFYIMATTGDAWDWCDCEDIEVIGNIHDNPELLKGGKDEN